MSVGGAAKQLRLWHIRYTAINEGLTAVSRQLCMLSTAGSSINGKNVLTVYCETFIWHTRTTTTYDYCNTTRDILWPGDVITANTEDKIQQTQSNNQPASQKWLGHTNCTIQSRTLAIICRSRHITASSKTLLTESHVLYSPTKFAGEMPKYQQETNIVRIAPH